MKNNYRRIFEELGVTAEYSIFYTEGGVYECHIMLHVEPQGEMFSGQLRRLLLAGKQLCNDYLKTEGTAFMPVFKRYFLSDAANQAALINEVCHNEMLEEDKCTVSYIQQPPLDGSKVALWIYLQTGTDVKYNADDLDTTIVSHNGYEHLWTMGLTDTSEGSYKQTAAVLESYEQTLAEKHDATIAGNCIRTWFFVRDVDTNYHGLVVARRENFQRNGLCPETHYIASTGIGGSPADTKALVQLGTYAIKGLQPGQQKYLYALSHLNKTIEYGVTFERATLVEYGDRGHIYISGTASIDNKGKVVHIGDIRRQTERMWENVEALLNEGGMDFKDMMQIIVYLRDTADYAIVSRMFKERFPDIPTVITLAPVCRPQWLIEMECIAADERHTPHYRNF